MFGNKLRILGELYFVKFGYKLRILLEMYSFSRSSLATIKDNYDFLN
jgi:hypothetical protein